MHFHFVWYVCLSRETEKEEQRWQQEGQGKGWLSQLHNTLLFLLFTQFSHVYSGALSPLHEMALLVPLYRGGN